MFNSLLKNKNIREKLLVLYGLITFWTLLYMAVALISLYLANNVNDSWESDEVMRYFIIFSVVFFFVYGTIIARFSRTFKKQVIFPLRRALEGVEKISKGNLDVQFEDFHANDEVSILMNSMREMYDSLRRETEILQRIADGDLAMNITLRDDKDIVYKAIKDLQDMNRGFIAEIKEAINQFSVEAMNIADGAQSLASGSSEQAATIEKFSAAIVAIKLKADENIKTSQETIKDIEDSTHLMQDNIAEIKRVNNFIDEFTNDSKQIAKVIKVIDDIAFQTNILALNAAVEAARAGQHGKGFAVVADEVRELASKSAKAAKETSDLIKRSLDNVAEGSKLVEKTNSGIETMGETSLKNQERMKALSEVSIQQGEFISEIDNDITQISSVIQANSSMADESAAAAQQMSAQASYVDKLISRYNTENKTDFAMNNDSLSDVAQAPLTVETDNVNSIGNDNASLTDFFPDMQDDTEKDAGFQLVDAAGPELEDFSKSEGSDKYMDD